MPNLFELPNWLILLPLLVYLGVIRNSGTEDHWTLTWFITLIGFDQLNFVVLGSLIDPLKAVIIIAILYSVVTNTHYKLGQYEILFLFWLVLRDLISMFVLDSDALSAARYSVQLYALYYGTFIIVAMLTARYSQATLIKSSVKGIQIALLISFVLALYQYAAFFKGLPINGIRNAYTEATGGTVRWAAYNIAGFTYFRSYALFGEPKFLGSFAVIAYAFMLFCYVQRIVVKRALVINTIGVVLILLLTASTSAIVSFVLVNLAFLFISKRGGLILLICILMTIPVLYLINRYGVDLFAFADARIFERLSGTDTAFESQEENYIRRLLSSPQAAFFGLGYSTFADLTYKGFRVIPNSVLINLGVNGGLLLIAFFIMTIARSLKSLRYMLLYVAAALVYLPISEYFILLLLATVSHNHLAQSGLDGAICEDPGNLMFARS